MLVAGERVENVIISTEDWGEIVCFLLIVAVNEFGDYIGKYPKKYSCPNYCEVDHEHINIIEQEIENYEYTGVDSTIFVQRRDEGDISEGLEREY